MYICERNTDVNIPQYITEKKMTTPTTPPTLELSSLTNSESNQRNIHPSIVAVSPGSPKSPTKSSVSIYSNKMFISNTAGDTQFHPSLDNDDGDRCLIFSLRVKTMSALFALFLVLLAITIGTLTVAFKLSFGKLEEAQSVEAALKTSRALYDDFRFVTTKVWDFATWDETYNLVQNGNATQISTFVDIYFSCTYMQIVSINYVFMYYANGSLVQGVGCYNMVPIPILPEELNSFNQSQIGFPLQASQRWNSLLLPKHNLTELFGTSGQFLNDSFLSNTTNILILSGIPIQKTDYLSTNGWIVFGRYENIPSLEDIAQRTQLCTTTFDLNDYKQKEELQFWLSSSDLESTLNNWQATSIKANYNWLSNQLQLLPIPYNRKYKESEMRAKRVCPNSQHSSIENRMASYQLFADAHGTKSLVIRSDFPRDVMESGWYSFLQTWAVLTAIIVISSLVLVLFIELVVLRRVLTVTGSVREIAKSNNVKQRVPYTGSDEIGRLSHDINRMLMALEDSQNRLTKDNLVMQELLEKTALEEQKSRTVMNAISDFIVTVECNTGDLITANNYFQSKVLKKKKSCHDLKLHSCQNTEGQNICNYLQDFSSLEELLAKLNENATSKVQDSFETRLTTDFNFIYQVSVTANKVRMNIKEGIVGNAYILVMKCSESKENLKNPQQTVDDEEFDKVMKDEAALEAFLEFAKFERSEENILFLCDVDKYRSLPRTKDRVVLQQEIINKYLIVDKSPMAINISNTDFQKDIDRIVDGYGQLDLFDGLEFSVKVMVLNDTFSRYQQKKSTTQ